MKHLGYFICFVTPFVFKHSEVTWNHWLSSDDVCSYKWYHREFEAYAYVFYKDYVSPYHVTGV